MGICKGFQIILIVISHIVHGTTSTYSKALEKELRTEIFTSYDRFISPNFTVYVNVTLHLYAINKLEIKEESMETALYFTMIWYDPRFDWSNNFTYSSIPNIRTNSDYVWVPTASIINSVSDLTTLGEKTMIIAHRNGIMNWNFGTIEVTRCICDVTYYPFDTQSCDIILFGVGYSAEEVEYRFAPNPVDSDVYIGHGEWEYLGYSTSLHKLTKLRLDLRRLKFKFTFRRRPQFYVINSLLPLTLLSCLTCMIFKLQADSGEKIGFCLTVLLAFAVYLTIISDHMPTTSLTTSYLSLYLIICLAHGIVSVILTIYILQCHHCETNKPVPIWLKNLTKYVMIPISCKAEHNDRRRYCLVCLTKKVDVSESKDNEEKKPTQNEIIEPNMSWQEIGKIMDSFCFYISLLCNISVAFAIYICMIYGYYNAHKF